MKTVFVGSVELSRVALMALIDSGVTVDLVCALDASACARVSDYCPLDAVAAERGIPCVTFCKIGEIEDKIVDINPDYLFVIGLSQIISQRLIDAAGRCAIGFHPTPLPRYRGRAPIPWMILLGEKNLKITLFKLDAGMDSGDILHQEPYVVGEEDYAADVYAKVCAALSDGIKKCVPALYAGEASFVRQNDGDATYLLIRRPEDGRIDWSQSGKSIHTLIRAVSAPYPGAFFYHKDEKIIVKRARLLPNHTIFGQKGQIAWINGEGIHDLAGDSSLIVLTEVEPWAKFVVGAKLK